MMLSVLAAAGATAGMPTRLNPVALFLHADIVVQVVMGALVLASVWVWTIVVAFSLRMGSAERKCNRYETAFWEARDVDAFHKENGGQDVPSAKIVTAAPSGQVAHHDDGEAEPAPHTHRPGDHVGG